MLPGYSYSSIDFTYDQKFSLRFDHPAEDDDNITDAIQKIAEDLNSERSDLFLSSMELMRAISRMVVTSLSGLLCI